MMFWFSVAVVTILVIAFVFLPVFKAEDPDALETADDVAFYKARLREIDGDVKLGRLDQTAAEAAKAEEARRLIKVKSSSQPNLGKQRTFVLPIAAALFVPVFSLVVYGFLGSPHFHNDESVTTQNEALGDQSLDKLLAAAEKRLEQNPDDVQGWIVVAPVYTRLNRFDKAIHAYQEALRLSGRNPGLLIGLAEVLVLKNSGVVPKEAKGIFAEVLQLQPGNTSALFYLGMAAYRDENWRQARDFWRTMLDQATGNEEWHPVVSQRVSELENKIGPAEQSNPAENANQDDRQEMIESMVASLAERLQENPDDREGWERLVRSYHVLGRQENALEAIEQATAYFSDDPDYIEKLRGIASGELKPGDMAQ